MPPSVRRTKNKHRRRARIEKYAKTHPIQVHGTTSRKCMRGGREGLTEGQVSVHHRAVLDRSAETERKLRPNYARRQFMLGERRHLATGNSTNHVSHDQGKCATTKVLSMRLARNPLKAEAKYIASAAPRDATETSSPTRETRQEMQQNRSPRSVAPCPPENRRTPSPTSCGHTCRESSPRTRPHDWVVAQKKLQVKTKNNASTDRRRRRSTLTEPPESP